jgi:predicted phosphodiesterase
VVINQDTPLKVLVIPDTQVREGVDTSHLKWISNYMVEKKPDVVIHLGDHWDMPSLSSYDYGKKTFEGKRYKKDIQAGNDGIKLLISSVHGYNNKQKVNGKKQYKPQFFYLDGNHDQRIARAVNDDAKLEGTIGLEDRDLTGWTNIPFLEPFILNDVVFCHYLTSGVMGRPVVTASALLAKKHQSCVVGHQQGRQVATATKADGSQITAIIAGSCYLHDEEYMGIQGNKHFRGIIMLHEMMHGSFDEMFVSLDFLGKKYK